MSGKASTCYGFFSDFAGFLFRPLTWAEDNLGGEESGGYIHYLYVFYISVLLGVSLWSFIFYPEPLYYGTSASELQAEIPSIVIADPIHSLLAVLASVLIAIFLYSYVLWGLISYALLKRRGRPGPALGTYLGFYAYSLTPLLFWIPVMALRSFFFERWIHLRPLYPFIDWTAANVAHLAVIAAFLAWKFIIEMRINQAAFKASWRGAMIPVLAQVCLLVLLLLFPLLLNDLFFAAFKDGLT